jgi:hypothetical protein
MEKDKNAYLTACAVVVHAMCCAALGIYFQFVVPKTVTYWSHFQAGVSISNPFFWGTQVSSMLRHFEFLVIAIVLGLLWIDARIHSSLLRRKGLVAASLWAGAVSIFLVVSLLFAAWAMTLPQVPAFYLNR